VGLINPRVELNPQGEPVARAVCSTPTIWADRPLAEILIEREGVPVWQKLATSKQSIEGPISWPLEPLKACESCTLKLRPFGALGGAYGKVKLIATDTEAYGQYEAWLSREDGLQGPPTADEMGIKIDTIIRIKLEYAARQSAAAQGSNET